jgi:hypothetical protein
MALSMTFARAVRRSVVRSALLLSVLSSAPQQALALPFDPVPSAFERWLNAKRDWPNNQRLRFADVSECADQSVRLSPYRMPVYTCLSGSVSISAPGQATRRCRLQRVSFFPSMQRLRYWTESCR